MAVPFIRYLSCRNGADAERDHARNGLRQGVLLGQIPFHRELNHRRCGNQNKQVIQKVIEIHKKVQIVTFLYLFPLVQMPAPCMMSIKNLISQQNADRR